MWDHLNIQISQTRELKEFAYPPSEVDAVPHSWRYRIPMLAAGSFPGSRSPQAIFGDLCSGEVRQNLQ